MTGTPRPLSDTEPAAHQLQTQETGMAGTQDQNHQRPREKVVSLLDSTGAKGGGLKSKDLSQNGIQEQEGRDTALRKRSERRKV